MPAATGEHGSSREVDISTEGSQMKKRTKKKTRDSNLAQKHRDLLKFAAMMQDSHANYVILGVENQMEVHYAMPVRNMVYDALQTIKYSVDAQKLTEYITQNERMHRLDLSAANVINI